MFYKILFKNISENHILLLTSIFSNFSEICTYKKLRQVNLSANVSSEQMWCFARFGIICTKHLKNTTGGVLLLLSKVAG